MTSSNPQSGNQSRVPSGGQSAVVPRGGQSGGQIGAAAYREAVLDTVSWVERLCRGTPSLSPSSPPPLSLCLSVSLYPLSLSLSLSICVPPSLSTRGPAADAG